MSRPTVVIELAGDAQFARDLAVGGVFVPGCTLRLTDECDLVVCGANNQITLPARVVYVEDQRGAGLELIGFSSEMKARLAELEPVQSDLIVTDEPALDDAADARSDARLELALRSEYDLEVNAPSEPVSVPLIDIEMLEAASARLDELALPELDTLPPESVGDREPAEPMAGQPGEADGDGELDEAGVRRGGRTGFARNVQERLRGLNLAAQIKMALHGEQHERIVLERLYGKNVWETLLRNPKLTAPEVAKIARYGSLPRVLLEIIVANNAWLQIPEVRRALLSNPRLASDQIMKVLRLTPKHELKLAAIQTAYPHAVRNMAKMMMRSE